jgi:hypothetical protein
VVDRVVVENLEREINNVRRESHEASEQNGELRDELAHVNEFVEGAAAYAVDRRLAAVPIALVAERGVDGDALRAMLSTLRAAGAQVPGVLWLDERWRLDTAKDLAELQGAAKVTGNNAAARAAALRLFARRITRPPSPRAQQPDVLEALRAEGFVELTDGSRTVLESFPPRAARVLVVTGTDSRLRGSDTMIGLVDALIDLDALAVVAEVYEEHEGTVPVPQRGAAIAPVRGDAARAKEVSTVDDAELPQGRVAVVIALEQAAEGVVGRYGYGPGASAPLPAPAP